jgi:hypothetical protein
MTQFFNIHTKVGDKTFHSRGEAARYTVLKQREKDGLISNLRCQVAFPLTVGGLNCGRYIADFQYLDIKSGKLITEDFKGGLITDLYKLKKKLVKALHQIDVYETQYANDP